MTNKRAKQWISLLAVIAVAVMIFLFSTQEGEDSAKLSEGVTEQALNALVPGYREFPRPRKLEYLTRADRLVRKAAHFSEYALLGLTLLIHLRCIMEGRRLRRIARLSWGIATLYAVTDELHQMFVSGRGPAALDVCIDSAGALMGALVGAAVILLWHRYKKKGRLA